jgi:hypothetical protein
VSILKLEILTLTLLLPILSFIARFWQAEHYGLKKGKKVRLDSLTETCYPAPSNKKVGIQIGRRRFLLPSCPFEIPHM